ncbi:MAG: rhodanese-like domain-containing protein [Thermodesulfobacteriota bacterium]
MQAIVSIFLRALVILGVWASVGLVANLVSPEGIPWVYVQAKTMEVAGIRVALIDVNEARKLYDDGQTVFVDARNQQDYAKGSVRGSVFLSPDDVHERFIGVQGLLPEDSRIVLYCYGPECDMAERVAEFLGQVGYRKMMIMTDGFAAWERAGYPVTRPSTQR